MGTTISSQCHPQCCTYIGPVLSLWFSCHPRHPHLARFQETIKRFHNKNFPFKEQAIYNISANF